MKYGSVCSGIESAAVAWHPLGWEPQWFCEIEPFPSRLLNHHYPVVPNLGDMMKIEQNEIFQQSNIDLLVGGTPCQSFSLAGLRGGLDDDRGNLALEFCRILIAKQPTWFLWENVPGVFSSFTDEKSSEEVEGTGFGNARDVTQTADFATVLSGFQQCGYSVCWRVLDAQHFGVPQQRRRVFIVGHIGNDWRPPFAVLFERQSLQRNITPCTKKGKDLAGTIDASAGRSRGAGINPGMITTGTITKQFRNPQNGGENLIGFRMTAFGEYSDDETASALKRRDYKDATDLIVNAAAPIIYPLHQITNAVNRSNPKSGDPSPALTKKHSMSVVGKTGQFFVRRLTPLECERLQGFPDNYTNIPNAKDSPRYEALGNSMAVPVMRWIGERIDRVEKIMNNKLT